MSGSGGGFPPRPPRGARRRRWTEVEFACLDFETTGLDLATDSVVSWGVVPVTRGGVDLRGADYRLVAPERPVRGESVRIHELRPVDLEDAPALRDVRNALGEALSGRFLLAWAATIEIAFLHRILGGAERRWRRRTIDVRELAVGRLRRDGEPVSGRGLDLESACRWSGPTTRSTTL
jgi:DNA polymerase-3 subunit epsilon